MFIYAQLNDDNAIFAISHLSGEVVADNMIDITNLVEQPGIGSTYNASKQTFTTPEPTEPTEPPPTSKEIQTQTLLNTEYLVIMSELTNL